MNKLLALAFIAVAAFCCFFPKEEAPRYKQVYYTHTVQHGENIFDIASKYMEMHAGKDYPRFVFSIRHKNGLLDGKRMNVGDVLIIPCLKKVEER